MRALARRLARLEAVMIPPPMPAIAVLREPKADATEEERTAFDKDLASARAAGGRVIVVVEKAGRSYIDDGVEYMSDFEAALEVAASRPSEQGRKILLDDVIAGMKGYVLGVAAQEAKP